MNFYNFLTDLCNKSNMRPTIGEISENEYIFDVDSSTVFEVAVIKYLQEKEEKTILSAKHSESPVRNSKPKVASKNKKNDKIASSKRREAAVKNNNVKPAFASVNKKNPEERTFVSKGKFAVQVASFDSLAKAKSEVTYLKSLHFDAYIDKTNVDGQMYFRVKIGRLANKAAAADLLEKVQEESRYSESFIVKEM